MWADTLLSAERAHLARLTLWAMSSLLAGTAVLAVLRLRRLRSPLLSQFAIQLVAWGAISVAMAGMARGSLALRDVTAARSLERFAWFNAGLEAGFVAVGATLLVTGFLLGRRQGVMGAGAGVVVHGLGLLVLFLQFAALLSMLV